jgi:chlorobactene glucosyltransferase
MLVLYCGALWLTLVVVLLLRALRQFRCYRQAAIPSGAANPVTATVSVIVPVRNEIANIEPCLAGIRAQTGLATGPRVVVVDDGSQDGTKQIVERRAALDPRIELVDAGPLPHGWTGKPHACWRGALAASGAWLCFIDADVRIEPELIATATAAAERQQIDMLSLHPHQELSSFWERIVIPAGLLVLACAKRFEPASQNVVNGQFLLIRRNTYIQTGGHSAVCGEICEDKALAALIKSSGFNLQVRSAPHLARTRMYRDLQSLWEGFSKNSADALGSVAATLLAAAATFGFAWAMLALPPLGLVMALAEPSPAAFIGALLMTAGSAVVIGIQLGTARHFRIPAIYGLMFAIGLTVVACLACRGVLTQLTGRVTWKGRTYRLTKTQPGRA